MKKLNKRYYFGALLLLGIGALFWIPSGGWLKQKARDNPTFSRIARPAYHAARIAIKAEYRTRFQDPPTISEYLKSHQVRKLQLGAGGNDPEGWLNSDIDPNKKEIYLDAMTGFPFPDRSFHYVFIEHVIEHLPWEGGVVMLQECYRIMIPGAKMRIITPNLDRFIALLHGDSSPDAEQYIKVKLANHGWPSTPVPGAYILNAQVRSWGHQFLYNPETLRKALEFVGFKQISEHHVLEKTDPVFQEAELRTRNPGSRDFIENSWEAMAFEVVR